MRVHAEIRSEIEGAKFLPFAHDSLSDWPHELHLLCALLSCSADASAAEKVENLLLQNAPDLNVFRSLVSHHRVDRRVLRLLTTATEGSSAARFAEDFAADRKETLNRLIQKTMAVERSVVAVSRSFEQAGISFAVVKGPAVAHGDYDFAYDRAYRDVDILVAPDHVDAAHNVLLAQGYTRTSPDFALTDKTASAWQAMACDFGYQHLETGVQLEVHWRLFRNHNLFPVETDGLLNDLRKFELGGCKLPTLTAPLQFVYLCVHGAKHTWFRLRWLIDIHEMMAKFSDHDVAHVVSLAQETGAERCLALAVNLVHDVFGAPVPAGFSQTVKDHTEQRLLTACLRSMVGQDGRTHLQFSNISYALHYLGFQMRLKADLRFKLSVLLQKSADPRDIKALGLSKEWLWVYRGLAPVLFLGRLLARYRPKN